jgi:hypothetical protein
MPSVEDLWATRQLDDSRIPLSMRNDSALDSRWFLSLGHASPTTPAENPKVLVHRAIAPFFGVGRIVDDRYPARVRSSDLLRNSDRFSA